MSQKNNPLIGMLIAGVIMLFVFGSHCVIFLLQKDNIWWTPASMKLSVEESRDRVEVFIGDKLLQDALDNSELLLRTDSETIELSREDIGFRMNNWDRVRASQIWSVAMNSVATTAAVIMIVWGLTPFFRKHRDGQDDIVSSSL